MQGLYSFFVLPDEPMGRTAASITSNLAMRSAANSNVPLNNGVAFDPKPFKVDRTTWGLRTTLPDGQSDIVSGFESIQHATTWLNGPDCIQWLAIRGYMLAT